MKSKFIFIFIFFVFINASLVLSQNKSCSLQIEISDIKSDEGEIALRLTSHDGDVNIGRVVSIRDHTCVIQIDSLSSGKYMISYFHDENSNDKLDTNWMGIPTEGFGFSNNARSNFGSPSIEERKFEIKGDLEIKLIPKY
jgi:uncharacterized protein (DUF2141 family)